MFNRKFSFVCKTNIALILLFLFFCSFSQANDKYDNKYYNLAIQLQKKKQYKESETIFLKGINKNYKNPRLHFGYAKLKQNYMKDCQTAIREYTVVIKLMNKSPSNIFMHAKSYYKRGNCLYDAGFYKFALSDYNNCFRLKPNYPRVYFSRAKVYAKLNMIREAEQDLKTLVKQSPKFKRAADNLWNKIISKEKYF